MAEDIGTAYITVVARGDKLNVSVKDAFEDAEPEFNKAGKRASKSFHDGFDDDAERRGSQTLRKLAEDIDDVGEKVSRAFGKGSRNDGVNFFGSFLGAGTKALGLAPKLLNMYGSIGRGITDAFKGGADFLKNVKAGVEAGASFGDAFALSAKGAEGLGVSLAPVLTALSVLGPALLALVVVLPVVASTIALLTGAVTALAASLTFAAVGALAPLLGLLAPLSVGLGVLVAGIFSLDDATKKALGNSLKPLTGELKSLGDVAAKGIFRNLGKDVAELTPEIRKLRPLVRDVGREIGDFLGKIADGFKSDKFDAFIKSMETAAPNAIDKLGTSVISTFGGLSGIFIALNAPGGPVAGFLDWLEKITDRFSDFTNSAEGQDSLARFFDDAQDSAESVFELIDNIGEAIGALFTQGRGAGDTIIDHLAEKVQEFTDYLNANPDAVAHFFSQAVEFADGLGNAILGVIDIFDALDSEASRTTAIEIFNDLGDALQFIGQGAQLVEDAFKLFKGSLEILFTPIRFFIDLLTGGVGHAVAGVIDSFATFVDGLAFISEALDAVVPGSFDFGAGKIHDAADGLRDLAGKLDDVKNSASGTAGESLFGPMVTDLQKIIDTSQTTDASLRQLLGLPPLKLKADKTDIDAAKAATQAVGTLFSSVFGKNYKVAVDPTQIDHSDAKAVDLYNSMADIAGIPRIKLEVDAAALKTAQTAASSILSSIRSIISLGPSAASAASPKHSDPSRSARGSVIGDFPRRGFGGLANFQQNITAGEAGREAIVPLDRPLGEVDPSVRYLAAVAQGQSPGTGRSIVIGDTTIITPTEDPYAVAREVFNEFAANGLG